MVDGREEEEEWARWEDRGPESINGGVRVNYGERAKSGWGRLSGGELRARGRIALKSGCCDPDRL